MPKTLLDVRGGSRPLLDLDSYGRGGPKGGIHLSADQIAAIDRTVQRVPEVMVKGKRSISDALAERCGFEFKTDSPLSTSSASRQWLRQYWRRRVLAQAAIAAHQAGGRASG
jgi:hypothetical protein